MYMNGTRYDFEFKGWVHPPQEEGGNVIGIGDENLRAQFSRYVWDTEKGKVSLGELYHSVEDLLDQEECMSCDEEHVAFSLELDQVVAALDAYKGATDTTPRSHSVHDNGYGFYPRTPEM